MQDQEPRLAYCLFSTLLQDWVGCLQWWLRLACCIYWSKILQIPRMLSAFCHQFPWSKTCTYLVRCGQQGITFFIEAESRICTPFLQNIVGLWLTLFFHCPALLLKFCIVRPRALFSRPGKAKNHIGTLVFLHYWKQPHHFLSWERLVCSKPKESVGRAHAIGRKVLRLRKATRTAKKEDNLRCMLAFMVAGYWSFDCYLGETNVQ